MRQKPFKIRKCYLPFKQAMVWCGNCWKVLKWYLLNNNINIFCILELWQLNTWTWRCFGSMWLYVFNGCFFLCLSGNTETSWDYVIVNINQVPKIHCCQIKECLLINMSYLTDSYIGFTLKMESASKNTILGLKMLVKSGLKKSMLKSLHVER